MSGCPSIVAEHVGSFVNDMEAGNVYVDSFEWRRLYKKYEHENGRQNLHLDLNHNFETFKYDPVYDGRINPLLSYIRQSAKSTNLREAVKGCDFVTNRGTLKSIGVSVYSQERGWNVVCCKFQDIVFMCEIPTEEHQKERMNDTEADRLGVYRGHKFENYLLSDSPETPPNTEEPVSTLAPQYGVFKSTGTTNDGSKMTFLMNAEMDGIDRNNNFLELKTTREAPAPKKPWHQKSPNWYFEHKCNWWLQSYLVGVERIIVGMRNREGIVSAISELNTRSVYSQQKRWHPSVCLNNLFNCLKDVREHLNALPELSMIKLAFSEKTGKIDILEVEEHESAHYKFLPDDFIQYFSQQDVHSESVPDQDVHVEDDSAQDEFLLIEQDVHDKNVHVEDALTQQNVHVEDAPTQQNALIQNEFLLVEEEIKTVSSTIVSNGEDSIQYFNQQNVSTQQEDSVQDEFLLVEEEIKTVSSTIVSNGEDSIQETEVDSKASILNLHLSFTKVLAVCAIAGILCFVFSNRG